MKSFKQHIREQKEITTLLEKQLIIGKGKRYGQVVFMAGGAGSGKGFAVNNFMDGGKFKVRDVDQWKKAFITLSKTKEKYKDTQSIAFKRTTGDSTQPTV